ncbi:MAG: MFS transporter [Bacteroidales bacterium]|jgi:predicted MFS family arabinose efflux permease|nr:MFS transporter [Bacteroidales bacterium]
MSELIEKKALPRLWTKNFILVFSSTFAMFFSFYLLVPILPFYVTQELGASETQSGIIISLYILSALCVRPLTTHFVDTLPRKPLYLCCFCLGFAVLGGYLFASSILLFIVLRILHGASFGLGSVTGNTLGLDLMPAERRGEGIGYFGVATNLAMAIGPMTGIFFYTQYDFAAVFVASLVASALGIIAIVSIRYKHKVHNELSHTPPPFFSLDRFILKAGVRSMICFSLLGIGYGVIINYIGVYSVRNNFGEAAGGVFFCLQAGGLIIARLSTARLIDRGLVNKLVYSGFSILLIAYILLIQCDSLIMFYFTALLFGIGFGCLTPAFQMQFVNLAPHNRRGTAVSSYYTSWDAGIGLGIAISGYCIEQWGFTVLFILCLSASILSIVWYFWQVQPFYNKNKLY